MKIKIGSRDSVLAIKQAEIVIEAVKEKNAGIEFEHVKIKTAGDKILDRSLDEIGGKGLFIKELEQALADGSIDIAVHSYKDMPYEETEDLPIVALSGRESPFDVLILPQGKDHLDKAKPIGSSSQRRAIQFSRLYDGFEIKPIRGNVPTRLSKLDNGEYSALILAQAGLIRLSLQNRINRVFTDEEMIPSGSQGILAVQGRKGDDHTYLDSFHDTGSEIVSKAERQYLKTLGTDCTSPAAVYAKLQNNEITVTAMYVSPSGNIETGQINGPPDQAELLGYALAKRLSRT